jgi:hypothetical protein
MELGSDVRIFKTRDFARLIRKTDIDDRTLAAAVDQAAKGLVDAQLGSGLIKQRIGRKGQGKSGGYRTIIALRAGDRAVFMHCFAKNEQASITEQQLQSLRELATHYLTMTGSQVELLLRVGELIEVKHGR